MKIKEVSAGVKVSQNYNSYSVNLVADIEDNESYDKVGEVLIEKAKEIIDKKLDNKKIGVNEREIEVGAAWYSRDFPGKLSVQYSEKGVFSEVDIKDLERQGFVQEINNQKYLFKRIPIKKRRNNKMPVFRIYKEGEKWKKQRI